MQRMVTEGMGEADSYFYVVTYLNCYASLYEFSTDPLLRQMARLTADWVLAQAASTWLDGYPITAPVGRWVTETFADRFVDEVLGPGAVVSTHLDQRVLRQWFDEHRQRRADRSYALWAAWMLERWGREARAPDQLCASAP